MGAWDAWIGRRMVGRDLLTDGMVRRFNATMNRSGACEGVPQAINWLLCTPDATTAELGVDGHPQRTDGPDSFLPPVPYPRRMWASSKVEFLLPLHVSANIERVSTIAAISEKAGSAGKLVFVDLEHETSADGAIVTRERQTLVYREADMVKPAQVAESAIIDFGEWDFHRTLVPNEALLFRYSAITFNAHRIHYDFPYATNVEGYRGLVVHGPLSASLLLTLAADHFGPNAVREFAFRAQSPAFAGEPLHLVGRRAGSALTLKALNDAGHTVMAADAVLR